jgi:hypothetical protein
MPQPLADALRDTGLTPCLYVRVTCRKHGQMRVAATKALERCPHCSGPVQCLVLGKGGTKQQPRIEEEQSFAHDERIASFLSNSEWKAQIEVADL